MWDSELDVTTLHEPDWRAKKAPVYTFGRGSMPTGLFHFIFLGQEPSTMPAFVDEGQVKLALLQNIGDVLVVLGGKESQLGIRMTP